MYVNRQKQWSGTGWLTKKYISFNLDFMNKKQYSIDAKPTALPPETVRRQFFSSFDPEKRKIVVFIDGSNWYHKLRRLLGIKPPIDFDLRSFVTDLVTPDTVVDIRYYIGKVKRIKSNIRSESLYNNQQKVIRFLQRQKIHVGFGHLINYPDGSFHEKGVDILLAVEMIRCVLEKKCDVAYLISSDTDLVPAVDECRRLGGEVVYVGSSLHGQSFGLTKVCNRTILLRPRDVLPYVPPKLF
jgi:uncharacterized LabA/DUF88 family protein